jgi:colanic acid biosynthesis protein WcaH
MPDDTFATVVANTPLVSIDLVLRSGDGEVLMGRRRNRPAQGSWFVPGGRIRKDERIAEAFERIGRDELGLTLNLRQARFLGVFEHLYPDSFPDPQTSTHYVVMAFELKDVAGPGTSLRGADDQHAEFRWVRPGGPYDEAGVHPHCRPYLEPVSSVTVPGALS